MKNLLAATAAVASLAFAVSAQAATTISFTYDVQQFASGSQSASDTIDLSSHLSVKGEAYRIVGGYVDGWMNSYSNYVEQNRERRSYRNNAGGYTTVNTTYRFDGLDTVNLTMAGGNGATYKTLYAQDGPFVVDRYEEVFCVDENYDTGECYRYLTDIYIEEDVEAGYNGYADIFAAFDASQIDQMNALSSLALTFQTTGDGFRRGQLTFYLDVEAIDQGGGNPGGGGAVGAVPEPAAWAMMIGGFGLAGAMLRRRRAAVAI